MYDVKPNQQRAMVRQLDIATVFHPIGFVFQSQSCDLSPLLR